MSFLSPRTIPGILYMGYFMFTGLMTGMSLSLLIMQPNLLKWRLLLSVPLLAFALF